MNKELNIKAILIGFATIFGISFLMGLGIAVSGLLIPLHSFPSNEELKSNLPLVLSIGGMISRLCGGFVTGWIAKHDQLKNAFALAIVDLILAETIVLFLGSGHVSSLLLGIVKGVFFTLSGGYLAKLAFKRKGL